MKDTAEEFARYLSGKHWGFTEVRPPTALPKPPPVPIEKGPITGQEIRRTLRKAKNNKAAGPDHIPLALYKMLTAEQLDLLA